MPSKEREYREQGLDKFEAKEYIVEGYASTWDSYELFDGISERIDSKAFDQSDFTDCVFNYNHAGRVFARTRNGSLQVMPDEHGLKIRADLSRTPAARDMWEDIAAGNIDQMSFAFIVEDDEFEKATRTRIVKRIGKVYDVSAVSLPANPGTNISARSYCDGVIAAEQAERLAVEERERQKQKIRILAMKGVSAK